MQGFANAMVWLSNPSFFKSFKRNILMRFDIFKFFFRSEESRVPLLGQEWNAYLHDDSSDFQNWDAVMRLNIITFLLYAMQESVCSTLILTILCFYSSFFDISTVRNRKACFWEALERKRFQGFSYHQETVRIHDLSSQLLLTHMVRMLPRADRFDQFKFVDYSPLPFQKLRAQAGISPEDYMVTSLTII